MLKEHHISSIGDYVQHIICSSEAEQMTNDRGETACRRGDEKPKQGERISKTPTN
jgi:hypothetical protein